MRLFNKPLFLLFVFSLCSSCASTHQTSDMMIDTIQKTSETISTSTPSTLQNVLSSSTPLTLIYVPHPKGDPAEITSLLMKYPSFYMTLVFPPRYFDDTQKRASLTSFRTLLSSGQIEIGLSLDNNPVLPLLDNLKQAVEKTSKGDFNFSWPEDVAYQVARGSSKYQKRWGILPSGFLPPYRALSENSIDSLKRFRLNWVLGQPNSSWGIKFMGALALMIPEPQPIISAYAEGTAAWGKELSGWVMSRPFSFVDASQWEDPEAEKVFLRSVIEMAQEHPAKPLMTTHSFCESLDDEYELSKGAEPFMFDYSKWVSTNQQKRVWRALSEARDVIEKYKNSGKANLQRLDAATEEMASAQDGSFILSLAENEPVPDSTEKNFLATLANIYRLCNTPIPTYLNSLFGEKSFQKAPSKPLENDRPFFIEGAQSLTWNDPEGDDNGGGQYIYPVGNYPKGTFDLRELTLEWNDSMVTFTITTVKSTSLSSSAVLPMGDIYIDINKLSGAGSTTSLKKRFSTLIYKEAAWEYAVSITPNNAVLFQSVPGSEPRVLRTQSSAMSNHSFSAHFPRTLLRGDPQNWRLSMGLLGVENTRKIDEFLPIPVSSTPGDRNFGGGISGRTAPPYIDVMAASVQEQENSFASYLSGGKIFLNYFEPK